jgi:hypothetical protein
MNKIFWEFLSQFCIWFVLFVVIMAVLEWWDSRKK